MVCLSSKQQEASIALTSVPVGPHTMGCPREKEEHARSGLSLLQPQLAGQVRAGSWSEGRVRKEELQAAPELLGWLQTLGVCPIAESLCTLGTCHKCPKMAEKPVASLHTSLGSLVRVCPVPPPATRHLL